MAGPCDQNPLGACSTSQGISTTATGAASHAEEYQALASADTAHAEGTQTTASGPAAHSEGIERRLVLMQRMLNFGRLLKDEQGERILNPDYNPALTYTSRLERPEWVAVGMLGKLVVRDDGSCIVNGYCQPNSESKATAASEGYRVMERINESLIRILFR